MLRTTSRTRWGLLATSTVGFGAFLIALHLLRDSQRPRTDADSRPAALKVTEDQLACGTVVPTNRFERTISIRNESSRLVTISGFERSCGCLSIVPSELEIEPGGVMDVTLAVNLLRNVSRLNHNSARDFRVTFRPIIRGPLANSNIAWQLHGKLAPPLVDLPASINLGTEFVRGMPAEPTRISIIATHGVESIDARCTSSQFEVSVRRQTQAITSYELQVAPTPVLTDRAGPFEHSIDVDVIATDGRRYPHVIVIYGEVIEKVVATPTFCQLGPLTIGEIGRADFVLTSKIGEAFAVREVIAPNEVQVELLADTPVSHKYTISKRASQAGKDSSEIIFLVSVADEVPIRVPVRILCFGTSTNHIAKRAK